jgi:PAS domain S-box-containing protein
MEDHSGWLQNAAASTVDERVFGPAVWTQDILKLMGIITLAAGLIISLGILAGWYNLSDAYLIYPLLVLILLGWWGAQRGGWRWASFLPIFLCLFLGAFSSYNLGLNTSMVLFYVLAVLLAGLLQGQMVQILILVASILAHLSLGIQKFEVSSLNFFASTITFTFCLTGISLLQWYFYNRLRHIVSVVMSSAQALQRESQMRQQAEAAQSEEAARLSRLAENITDMVVEMDADGIITYSSPSLWTHLGYPPQSMIGRSAYELMHADDISQVKAAVQIGLETHSPTQQLQVRARHAAGHYFPVEISGTTIYDSNHRIAGYLFSSRDISERRLVENALMESEWKFRNIIEAAPLGIHMFVLVGNDELIFSGYNPAANHILGLEHAALLGKPIKSAFPDLAQSQIIDQYRQIAREGGRLNHEQQKSIGNQTQGVYEAHAFQTIPNHLVVMFFDITERNQAAAALRQSEEKFSKAFLTSPDAININRLSDGAYIEINQGFTQLMGYTYDEVIGKSSLALNIWADAADRAHLVKGLREKGQVENLEAHFRRKNGSIGTGLMSARVLEINAETCILSVTRDISERQQAEQDLRAAHEELACAYEATLQGWVRALEMRERETAHHSRRVVELTTLIAQALGIQGEELLHIQRGALLHDIGKMGVPDKILLKPEGLTPDEWVTMRQHPQFAVTLLQNIDYLHGPMDIPYCHHEKWDGSGYPRGLKGEEIPIGARIFAIVDVYDALTSDRAYRPAWTQKDTLSYIHEQKGMHFDPALVDLFLKIIASQ